MPLTTKPSPVLSGEPPATGSIEDRLAPRFALLIKTAKLVVDGRQFPCLLRNISATGVQLQLFRPIPPTAQFTLEFDDGSRIMADCIWRNDRFAGFRFHDPIDVASWMRRKGAFARREMRFDIDHPAFLQADDIKHPISIANISCQGGLVACRISLSINQPVLLSGDCLPIIAAHVRWRAEGYYGLAFETVFAFGNLAELLGNLASPVTMPRPEDQATTKSIAAPFIQ